MSVQDILYRQEIYNYVNTLNIKFSPFAEMVATYLYENTNYEITEDIQNPYYHNICGYYNKLTNKEMFVKCIETGGQILFSRRLIDECPLTWKLYTIDSNEYKVLCDTYPDQVGLIKCIIYPAYPNDTPNIAYLDEVSDKSFMNKVLYADDFTILNHDPTYLKTNEKDSLIASINRLLDYIKERWFIRDFSFENLYPLAFMSGIYSLIPVVLLSQRVRNLDTNAVHRKHVWERLADNGIGDYEDILTDVQSRFLYRNIRYIKANRGRKSNLMILADNLLRNLKVTLVGKSILQDNRPRIPEEYDLESYRTSQLPCMTLPNFLSEEIVSYDPTNSYSVLNTNEPESMDHILLKLWQNDHYPDYSYENSLEKEDRFSLTQFNEIPTNLLELKKYTINTQWLILLCEFLYDSLMYQTHLNHLNITLTMRDENTNNKLILSYTDAIILLDYTLRKRFYNPTMIPNRAVVRIPYKDQCPSMDSLPKYINFFDNYKTVDGKEVHSTFRYVTTGVLNVKKLLQEIPWNNTVVYKSEIDFVKILGDQFKVLVDHTNTAETSADMLFQYLYYSLYSNFVITGEIPLKLSKYTKYVDWITNTEGIKDLIEEYDKLPSSRQFYDLLANQLIRSLLPIEHSDVIQKYVGSIYDNTVFYTKLKELFIYLTSHDLEYLDTTRDQVSYIKTRPISVMYGKGEDTSDTDIGEYTYEIVTHTEVVDPINFMWNTTIEKTHAEVIDHTYLIDDRASLANIIDAKITDIDTYQYVDVYKPQLLDMDMNVTEINQRPIPYGINLIEASPFILEEES